MRLALGLRIAGHKAAGGINYFVDSVNGDDGNTGTAEDDAFETLGALETAALAYGDGVSVALAKGSTWRESLDLSSLDNVTVQTFGSGNAPIITGADVETGWTVHTTHANVYEASVAHEAGGTERGTVYEDGVLLNRVADAATCQSTAGSFVIVQGSDGTPWNMQIHPSDSGNPTSNGMTYEVSVRADPFLGGIGLTMVGPIEVKAGLNNNGWIDVSALDATVSRTLTTYGTKHHGLIRSGSLTDAVVYENDAATASEASNVAWVFYAPDADGLVGSVTRLFGIGGTAGSGRRNVRLLYAHDGSANEYDTINVTGSAVVDMSGGFGPTANNVTMDGVFCRNSELSNPFTNVGVIKRLLGDDIPDGACLNVQFIGSSPTVLFEDIALYAPSAAVGESISRPEDAGTYTYNQLAYVSDGNYSLIRSYNANTKAFTVTKCILMGKGTTLLRMDNAGETYTGDYNIFDGSPGYVGNRYLNNTYTTLADWQTAVSADANSVYITAAQKANLWLGDPTTGDFRINPSAEVTGSDGTIYTGTFADGTTPITDAGPQTYWDWNARASAAGPPTTWPDVPETLSEAQTYIAAPAAWDFYP